MLNPTEHNILIAARAVALLSLYMIALVLRRWPYLWALLWWPGTVAHELAHFFVGLFLGANPTRLTAIPRRNPATGGLVLGEVIFTRLRWWNKLPVGVAPLLLLLPLGLWFVQKTLALPQDNVKTILIEFAALQCFVGCWPSPTDWALARTTIYALMGLTLLAFGVFALLRF